MSPTLDHDLDSSIPWAVRLSALAVDARIVEAVQGPASSVVEHEPRVTEFARAFIEPSGAHQALAVSSAAAALRVALVAISLAGGDDVILPS